MMRPGVPTTMCAPCSRLAVCGRSGTPPHSVSTLRLSSAARQAAHFLRDLVGQLARGAQHQRLHARRAGRWRSVRRASKASAKAAVLPLPVLAWAIRSCPASASGRLAAWIGVMPV